MKKYSIITVIVFLLSACFTIQKNSSNTIKYYKFSDISQKIKIIQIDTLGSLEPFKKIKRSFVKYYYDENNDIITIFKIPVEDNYYKSIYKIDYSAKTGKIIAIDTLTYPTIFHYTPYTYKIIGENRILYEFQSVVKDNKFVYDSSIVVADFDGNIKKIYELIGSDLPSSSNTLSIDRDISPRIMDNIYLPLCIKDSLLFVFFQPNGNYLGEYSQKLVPIAGYLNLNTGEYKKLNVFYPDINFGYEFQNRMEGEFSVIFAHNGDLLFSFKYTPNVILCNYKTGETKKIIINDPIIDSVYKFENKEDVPTVITNLPFPQNWTIVYDKYRHLYYRVTWLPVGEYNGKSILTVLDTNFNVVGQQIIPFQFLITPLKDKILLGGYFVKFNYTDGTNTQLIDELKKYEIKPNTSITVEKYFKKRKIKIKNDTVMVLWHDAMCNGISEGMIDFYIKNKKALKPKNQKLLVVTQNPQVIEYVKSQDTKNIFIDSTDAISNCVNSPHRANMPVFMFFRNKKLVKDTVYNISSVEDAYKIQSFIMYGNYKRLAIPPNAKFNLK